MQSISNMLFRDNVRGDHRIPVTEDITRIVDCEAFQRLRHIRQMGLSSYVYQTAEHSRFAHSLGVYASARETFRSLAQRAPRNIHFPSMRFDEHAEREFCIAAMCHDLGHTAFSHVLEGNLLPRSFDNHEECTVEILRDDEELRKAIGEEVDIDSVMLFIRARHPNKSLSHLVSGLFDLDRCDYLLRDSENSGVRYGHFDFPWLLHTLSLSFNTTGQPILAFDGAKGLEALRQFLAARQHMYRQVYYQPTIRAAEILLKSIFERISHVGIESLLVRRCPKGLQNIVQGDPVTIDDFRITTDIEVIYFIRMLSEESSDPVLKRLCSDFRRRRFPKAALDSGRSHLPIDKLLVIEAGGHGSAVEEDDGLLPLGFKKESDIILECQQVAKDYLIEIGDIPELAEYLVRSDPLTFTSYAKTEIKLSYTDHEVLLDQLATKALTYPCVPELTETFKLYRVYAPEACRNAVAERLARHRSSPNDRY